MKKIYQQLTLLLFVLGTVTIQAQFLNNNTVLGEFLGDGDRPIIIGNPIEDCRTCSELEDFSFSFSNSLNVAFANDRRIKEAARQEAEQWYNRQTVLMHNFLNNFLGSSPNYNEARRKLFVASEKQNIVKNSPIVRGKFSSRRNYSNQVRTKNLKDLKALKLREAEIRNGTYTSSLYADIVVNGIPLRNMRDINTITRERNKILSDDLYKKLWESHQFNFLTNLFKSGSPFYGKLERESAQQKNNIHNSLDYWDKLNYVQLLIHAEQIKKGGSLVYFNSAQQDVFRNFTGKIDIAIEPFIEIAAWKEYQGDKISKFHPDYWKVIWERDFNKSFFTQHLAQASHQQLMVNLLNESIDNIAFGANKSVDFLVSELRLASKDQYEWLNANASKAVGYENVIKQALSEHGDLELSAGRDHIIISGIPEVHNVLRDIVYGGQIRSLDKSLDLNSNFENFLFDNPSLIGNFRSFLRNNNNTDGKRALKIIENIILRDCYSFATPYPPSERTILDERFEEYFNDTVIFIQEKHPEWSRTRVLAETLIIMFQNGLDIIGLVPALGEGADLLNGTIYAVRGEYRDAVLSFSAMIPVGGILATSSRIFVKAVDAFDGTKKTLSFIKKGNNLIEFGPRGKLRKVIRVLRNEEAHHILPWAKRFHAVIQKAADWGFHMNDAVNGVALKKFVKLTGDGLHGNHPAYDDVVIHLLDSFNEKIPDASGAVALQFLEEEAIPELLSWIERAKGSGLSLNEYFKTVVKPFYEIQ